MKTSYLQLLNRNDFEERKSKADLKMRSSAHEIDVLHDMIRNFGQNRNVTETPTLDGVFVANAASQYDQIIGETYVEKFQ